METQMVSIIIPVYNRAELIKQAVMSALLQTHDLVEVIVVNDGSTDCTQSVVSQLAMKWSGTVLALHQVNSGPGAARQRGTSCSSGKFIQYLDSDDILLEDKIKCQVNMLERYQDAGICYGISYQEDHAFSPPLLVGPLRYTGSQIDYLFPKLLNERWWTTSCPLYRIDLVRMIGAWTDLVNEEDWEFDARAGKRCSQLAWVETGVSVRRINIGNDHLSYGGTSDPRKLRDRLKAKVQLYYCAIEAGVPNTSESMKKFSRECFFLARQTGELGMENESANMYKLAEMSNEDCKSFDPVFLLYGWAGHLLGWNKTARLALWFRSKIKR